MNIGIKLNRLNTEDFIWVIYFFIAIFAIISDVYERNYLKTNNKASLKKFKTINITIFTVALFIYIYFVFIRYQNLSIFRNSLTKKEILNNELALISSLLFLIGGIIILYVEITSDTQPDIGFP